MVALLWMCVLVALLTERSAAPVLGAALKLGPLPLTRAEKQAMLDTFNFARAQTVPAAANMKALVWDDAIAERMQWFTNLCVVQRVDERTLGEPLNEPVYLAYRDRTVRREPVKIAWWRTLKMAPFFDYYTGGCIDTPESWATCRHPENYALIVQAGNERVGCAVTQCTPIYPDNHGVIYGCGVAGTYDFEFSGIWKEAASEEDRCSACPEDYQAGCVMGLCNNNKSLLTLPKTARPSTRRPSRFPTTRNPVSRKPSRFPTTRNPISKKPSQVPTPPTTRVPTVKPTSKSPTTRFPTTLRPSKSPTTKRPTSKRPSRSPTTKRPTSKRPTRWPTTKNPISKKPSRFPTTRSPTLRKTTG